MLRRKTKIKWIIAIILVMALSIFFKSRFFIVANEIARAQATRGATNTINKIANQYLSENSKLYEGILVKDKSPEGNISAINTDIEKINRLQTEMSAAILHGLSASEGITVKIPLGNIIGLPILLNIGPKISYKIAPVSNVRVKFEDSFKSAGINQTQFSVNLIIETDMLYTLSAYQSKVSITNTIPVVQLVLVGNIPNNYANFQLK
ncbi:MAG: sporulation protein YunB [Monoglobales bacterium]